ncbi:GNAT family N-acetyltransferase [Actinophytocola sp.]|uniref:GNAT family N-acetyltransferase n=1 Tax=Actinophytocola sp. TaxID=1872138 RepID=UPI0025BDD5F2|nr:GNAT family N-acetyltransferase [Actinophytocola sp.]
MIDIRLAHTALLDATDRAAARALLDIVFDGLLDDDWEHATGGMHVLVRDGADLVAHGSVVQRRLLHGGRALRTGYVEAVGVHPARRGEGHAAAVMTAVEEIIRGGYDLGALGSSEMALGFHKARGWRVWRGPTAALTPDGVRRTSDDDGGVHVLPVDGVPLDLDGELVADWRDGDVW